MTCSSCGGIGIVPSESGWQRCGCNPPPPVTGSLDDVLALERERRWQQRCEEHHDD
jgi:hypothetical protein